MNLFIDSLIKLAAAALLGGVVGLEREFSHKPAGLRTNMLICSGAALLMIVSKLVAASGVHPGDPGRIAAQVVAGIGFLGAGVIVHSRGSVVGVTTGATIFTVAAIGLAVGGGYYIPAGVTTFIVIASLLALGKVEKRILPKNRQLFTYTITAESVADVMTRLSRILQQHGLTMESVSFQNGDDGVRIRFSISTSLESSQKLLTELLTGPGTVRVDFPREGM